MSILLPFPQTLAGKLRATGISDVRDDATTRAAYSSDASLYRVVPAAVAFPRGADEVASTLEVCRAEGIPLTSRGAGTSVAGNAIGAGVVMDFSRYMNKILDIDVERKMATVQPGTIHATLQKAALVHGLRFGPDPSTHTRCTVGGMIGNNACGSHSLAYGRTSDNVEELEILTGSGTRLSLTGNGTPETPETLELRKLVGSELAMIRVELGRFGRQVSGYALEHLLPENDFDLRRAMVGSEGTLGIVLQAGIRLVADAPHKLVVTLGYADIASAGDAVTSILPFSPTACEGLDSRIVDVVRRKRSAAAVPALPKGSAWLFVEISGDDPVEVLDRARAMAAAADSLEFRVIEDMAQMAALWKIRADGAGLAGRTPSGSPAHSGWEDSAVPPEMIGNYLRDFEVLLGEHQLTGLPYGHFGDGCLHIRLDTPFEMPDGTQRFRQFMTDAARLVNQYGGSFSGEHGDGRARSELLPIMYSPKAIETFGKVKAIFDPDNLLNPGILVDPVPLDADIRVAQAAPLRNGLAFGYHEDGGDFSQAVHRCTGVGKCRAATGSEGVMCPSYLATREEKDSTRGRARVLQEMINKGGSSWRSPEVHEALDLCLSCKGCSSDCPTGVDMATYKSEVLHQSYKGRLRPITHYSLGWLPLWAKLASKAPRLVNAVTRIPGVKPLGLKLAGIDRRRDIPDFATETFHDWFRRRKPAPSSSGAKQVLLWADSFTNSFTPETGRAAVRVLESAGYEVIIPQNQLCCGLTWISTGQLDSARRILGKTVEELSTFAAQGVPIVGLEPSCTAVLRADARELLGTESAANVAQATQTLAELLSDTEAWKPPAMKGLSVIAQPHCHHHAVMGWSADAQLLASAGADVQKLGGCCGLAGNFGVEKGHYDVSVAVAEQQLLPAVRTASDETVVLADGYSCRTQLSDLSDRDGIHLAQLLDQYNALATVQLAQPQQPAEPED